MQLFNHSQFNDHEQVSFFHDRSTGLKAIISIHNTNLGPALGGCRMWDYASEEEALHDVLRLSQGMTYKAALAHLPLGGGKSVIIGDSKKIKTPALMQSMGKAVQALGGNYIIAEDVGTSVADMNIMSESCDYVTGLLKNNTGSGDPSPVTAYGVFIGLKTAVKQRLQREELKGLKVAVQGLGNVGYHLCKLLHAEGVLLFVTDIDVEKVNHAVHEFGATPVAFNDIYDVEADVFAPCALGAIINNDTIKRLKVSIVAGGANNQLAETRHGLILAESNILYAPDYVINAGGVISVYYEYAVRHGIPFSKEKVFAHADKIKGTLKMIFAYAEEHQLSTAAAADAVAESLFSKKPSQL